ncbi:MAG: glycosyl transferase [Prevotellaceae bacterium]|jgi:mannosyltransferase OCH1-like enzyme|nr:glycosyl transferase [Prevotellaceae bacterium]
MIPKTIHYCWFGGKPLPPLARKCIKSWEKYLPGYTIKRWDENNFDINIIPYTRDAYQMKKYAFVSDYARFWILYKYGGIYFDTDVEVIKPMDDILANGGFMGYEENGDNVAPGLGIACPPGLDIIHALLDEYTTLSFIKVNEALNQTTVVTYTTDVLKRHGLKNTNAIEHVGGIYIYPKDYFCPKNKFTGKIHLTPNTYTIHHFDGSWIDKNLSFYAKQWFHKLLILLLGQKYHHAIVKKVRKFNRIGQRKRK